MRVSQLTVAVGSDLGTIPYEALTSISPQVKRVFVHEG